MRSVYGTWVNSLKRCRIIAWRTCESRMNREDRRDAVDPTAERLPAVDIKVRRRMQRFGGYIEGMVVITVKSKSHTLREVHFAMRVVLRPGETEQSLVRGSETPEGKVV